MSILELFCDVDDFCRWPRSGEDTKLFGLIGSRGPAPGLNMSKGMTILIHFHQTSFWLWGWACSKPSNMGSGRRHVNSWTSPARLQTALPAYASTVRKLTNLVILAEYRRP